MASLPWEHADEAIAEIGHARSIGASGICTLTNILGDKLTDPRFEPVWAAIEETGLPVFVHPTTPFVDGMGLEKYGLANTIGFTTDTSLCFANMFLDGFLDRHPKLKLIACHGGGALPYLIARFDQMWNKSTSAKVSHHPPSAYLSKVWYDAIVYDDATLDFLIEQVGVDRVMFGSDYPFLIGDMVGLSQRVKRLPADQRDKVLSRNAVALFGLGS
jgi:aminocarboxymuconate-semialdehyde decarboxylase